MGSVIDYADCPNCGQEAHNEFYYKSGEDYVVCHHCGYYKSLTLKDAAKEKKLSEITEDDYEFHELRNPYGSYRLKAKDTVFTQVGSIGSEEHFEHLKENLNYDQVESFEISRYLDGQIVKTMIYEDAPSEDNERDERPNIF